MPNWCRTEMLVCGTKDRLDEFLEFMTERGDGTVPVHRFSFQCVIPRPKELDVMCGSTGDAGYAAFFSENSADWERILVYPWIIEKGITTREQLQEFFRNADPEYEELGKVYHENLKKYGHSGWYGWNTANWGTKWNACQVTIDREADDRVFISFETAWSFPEPVFWVLFEKFDDLEFTGTIEEEGGFFYGNLTGHDVEFFDGVREKCEDDQEEYEDNRHLQVTPKINHIRKLNIVREDL